MNNEKLNCIRNLIVDLLLARPILKGWRLQHVKAIIKLLDELESEA